MSNKNQHTTKLPPQNKEIENAILGAIMLERDSFERANELIKAETFYVDAHRLIYGAMADLFKQNQPIDILTVCEQLKKTGSLETVGGEYYVSKLTNSVVSSTHIEHHCRVIHEKYLKRELIRIGSEMVTEGYEDGTDVFESMDRFEKDLQVVSNAGTPNTITDLSGEIVSRVKRILELQKQDHHITGVPSGYTALDRITHGWQPTDLIILAARPSVGKTAFALNLARNAARTAVGDRKPIDVGFFSLEMSKGQLVDRMLACESEVWIDKIQTGRLSESEIKNGIFAKGVQPLSKLGIYIDDTPALNIYQLRTKVRFMIRRYGVKMIIIDYLQLMSGLEDRKINNREQEISNISRNLKKVAKEENIPIIALSQLSRNVEQRSGEKKVPVLSDLRDSGAIEQDADMVMFMYRPDYYGETMNESGENTKGLTEISIAKHRNGSLANGPEAIKLKALLHIQKFVDWDGGFEPTQLGSGFRSLIKDDEESF
jgi:replicative DNA helicase